MVLFTVFFRQLLTKKEKKNTKISYDREEKEQKPVTTNSASPTSSSSSKIFTSSKEGRKFKYEGSRRYHDELDVTYLLPNDDEETDRIHSQHWILRDALKCNYYAPITKMLEEGIAVLDTGCGPATWTFEMAEEFPQSKFTGADICCVFPESIKPANVDFVVCNITKEIPFPDNTFDYIHQRLLFLGLTNEDWDNTIKELFRVLKPGGFIELAELDVQNVGNISPMMKKLELITNNAFGSRGLPMNICEKLEGRLIKAGFEKQDVIVSKLALNHSGKLGEFFWNDYKQAYLNCKPVLAKVHPEFEDDQAYADYMTNCGKEAREYKSYAKWWAVYAQKPLA